MWLAKVSFTEYEDMSGLFRSRYKREGKKPTEGGVKRKRWNCIGQKGSKKEQEKHVEQKRVSVKEGKTKTNKQRRINGQYLKTEIFCDVSLCRCVIVSNVSNDRSHQIKQDKMDGEFRTRQSSEISYRVFTGKPEGKTSLGIRTLRRRIILSWISK